MLNADGHQLPDPIGATGEVNELVAARPPRERHLAGAGLNAPRLTHFPCLARLGVIV
jgi:hypothetical protein